MFFRTLSCSPGIGVEPQQAENLRFRPCGNRRFLAFVLQTHCLPKSELYRDYVMSNTGGYSHLRIKNSSCARITEIVNFNCYTNDEYEEHTLFKMPDVLTSSA